MHKVDLDNNAQTVTSSWQAEQRNQILIQTKTALLYKGVQFNFETDKDAVKSIMLERTVFGEGLRKQVLFDALMSIVEAGFILKFEFFSKVGQSIAAASLTTTSGTAPKVSPYG